MVAACSSAVSMLVTAVVCLHAIFICIVLLLTVLRRYENFDGALCLCKHRELFEAWCEDPKNGVIIADFAVAGTLAREVLDQPKEVMSHSGHKVTSLIRSAAV